MHISGPCQILNCCILYQFILNDHLYLPPLPICFKTNMLHTVPAFRLELILFCLKVCGLKWSYDNRELASGGNDNRVCDCQLFHQILE